MHATVIYFLHSSHLIYISSTNMLQVPIWNGKKNNGFYEIKHTFSKTDNFNIPFKYPSSYGWDSVTLWALLTPAPHTTNGVSVSEGWPAPWEPRRGKLS